MAEARAGRAGAKRSDARSTWIFVGFSAVVGLGLTLGLRVGVGVEFDLPTLALVVACLVLVWALRGLWGIVAALANPKLDLLVVATVDPSRSELREEKRRVLRAIKELEFDHSMGKLSDADYRLVVGRYRMRAIEVIRALDEGGEIHPLLAEHLRALGLEDAASEALR